jgi:hypothetical protein
VKLALQFPQPILEIWKRNWEYSQQTIGNGVLESHLKSTIMDMVVEVKCESLIRIAWCEGLIDVLRPVSDGVLMCQTQLY